MGIRAGLILVIIILLFLYAVLNLFGWVAVVMALSIAVLSILAFHVFTDGVVYEKKEKTGTIRRR